MYKFRAVSGLGAVHGEAEELEQQHENKTTAAEIITEINTPN